MTKQKRPSRPPAQKKPPLTHFLCLPLVTTESKSQLETSLAKFRDDVTTQRPDDSKATSDLPDRVEKVSSLIHPKAVRPVGALHCTLGVMSLEPGRLEAAVQLLEGLDVRGLLSAAVDDTVPTTDGSTTAQSSEASSSLKRPISPPPIDRSPGPLTVNLKGLESMHAPQKTSILYTAPSDRSNRLYNFCLVVQKTFKDHGLLVEDNRDLKLHATLVNTIYTKGRKLPFSARQSASASGHGPNANAPLKIDATAILERYKDFIWAENVTLDRIAICEMGAKKILDAEGNVIREEYTEVAAVHLPS